MCFTGEFSVDRSQSEPWCVLRHRPPAPCGAIGLRTRIDRMARPVPIAGALVTAALVLMAGGCGFKSEPTGAIAPRR